MDKFAKLYEHEALGQILVMKTQNDDGYPHIRLIMNIAGSELAGGPSYNGTDDEAWDLLDEAFDKIDEDWAFGFAENLYQIAGGK